MINFLYYSSLLFTFICNNSLLIVESLNISLVDSVLAILNDHLLPFVVEGIELDVYCFLELYFDSLFRVVVPFFNASTCESASMKLANSSVRPLP